MEGLNHLLAAPPPRYMWLAVGVSFLSILLQVLLAVTKAFGYGISRNDRKQDAERNFEELWFEKVVLDRALPKIFNFVDTERDTFRVLTTSNYRDVNSAFSLRVEAFKGSLVTIDVLSTATYIELLQTVDVLTDAMTQHCAAKDGYAAKDLRYVSERSMGDAFDSCQNDCLRLLRKMHVAAIQPLPVSRRVIKRIRECCKDRSPSSPSQ